MSNLTKYKGDPIYGASCNLCKNPFQIGDYIESRTDENGKFRVLHWCKSCVEKKQILERFDSKNKGVL